MDGSGTQEVSNTQTVRFVFEFLVFKRREGVELMRQVRTHWIYFTH